MCVCVGLPVPAPAPAPAAATEPLSNTWFRATRHYRHEREGYLDLRQGDLIECLIDAAEPSDPDDLYPEYLFGINRAGVQGWFPLAIMVRVY
mmetsp:Transcript_12295/g.18643  ORF Transcript_12295/g.18643 Transcript_12295/m.18643 type:complete len:92 (+) Transcript_12295:19-294(+)